MIFSAHAHDLRGPEKIRYEQKVHLCGGVGPYDYDGNNEAVCDANLLQRVEFADIKDYLFHGASFVTRDELKAYKLMELHNYVTSGWVQQPRVRDLGDARRVVVRISFGHCVRTPHKLSSANLVYTGSASSQAAYAAAAYYATSSTSTTTTTTTTPRPFAYNLPYSPIDYYFDKNTASGGKSSAFKHGTTSTSSFKQPSGGGGGYYTSDDYEDENEDAEEAHRDRYLTRNDALKADYDSAETSPPTYVKTKYGYTSLNPLLMASESSKVSSGLHRGDMDKGAADGGGSGGGSRLGDKDVGDKGYATASSDHYDYKGGFVAADYADDFGFPDLDHHLPYLHRRKHHSGKGPLALLLGLLPLGLLMAALVPSVINLPVAAVGAVGPAGRRRREAAGPAYRNPILDSIAKFGVNSLEDPHCLQRIFCEVTAQGKAPESLPVQKVFYTLSTLVNDLWAERLGLKVLFGAVKKGQCDVFRCKAAKPTKQGKRRSSKLKNKGGTLKASKE
ncbi:hypothetical protein HPB49_022669 [Dermacentor silvarum]|uniref:Uncharacterized protein n=1 Tax=Dermacentor silvarum TaxID=543639 RepID=A0ACB8CHZ0_DERSI|nr:hypothetical protein HPB49_022669 [Dermacentor silvarum]